MGFTMVSRKVGHTFPRLELASVKINKLNMRGLILLLKLLLILSFFKSYSLSEDVDRDGKVISLFNVVKFKNDPCSSSSTLTSAESGPSNRIGTCLTQSECSKKSGMAAGTCASAFGVCCIFLESVCGESVQENCTYIRNPGFPEAAEDISTCKFTVQKCDEGVCALRLDFEAFTIEGPADTIETGGGACVDSFTASATATGAKTPVICGENSGQHIYLEIGAGENDQGALEFTFDDTVDNGRQFEIKVTQIFCNTISKPPDGCLQWLTGTDGRLTSFNFAPNTQHLADQNYNICIRQEKGFCCTKYQVCDDESSFSLDLVAMGADPTMAFSAEDELCKEDHIVIEASTSQCGSLVDTSNRYCGQHLADSTMTLANLEICDCTAPFIVGIKTENTQDALLGDPADPTLAVIKSRGICLNYVQIPCGMKTP